MDIQTFEKQALMYEKLLYRVSWSMLSSQEDCADAVQEALTRAWQSRSTLRNERAFKSWLVHILTNVCRDMLRKRQKLRFVPLEDDALATVADDTSGYAMIDMLQSLTPEHRLTIMLHYLEGYRVRDIAQMLDLPMGTIKSRLRSARISLRKTVDAQDAGQGGVHDEEK